MRAGRTLCENRFALTVVVIVLWSARSFGLLRSSLQDLDQKLRPKPARLTLLPDPRSPFSRDSSAPQASVGPPSIPAFAFFGLSRGSPEGVCVPMAAMKFGNFGDAQSVITQPSTAQTQQFPLDAPSVIKTAPPGSRHEFVSPKQEPLETSLQDLGKMQPAALDYYSMQNYGRVYAADSYLAAPQSITLMPAAQNAPSTALYYNTTGLPGTFAEWSAPRQMEYYPRATYPSEADARGAYKGVVNVVDMPSPVDSGIGADLSLLNGAAVAAAKEESFYLAQSSAGPQEMPGSVIERPERTLSHRDSPVVIAKIHNRLGFQYVLEAPISTSIRRDDDRMTYVNKGQYYNVVLSYIPDHQKPLQSKTVRSCLLLAFREDKTYDKEMETWCKWHKEQQNRRQRIIDYDLKNSSGLIGQVSETALNAIEFYWDPSEGPMKLSVAVQCLSTDFSPQKGVKGWPMHLQIDTFDDENAKVPFHRGYCQIKVFCDKGANRKMLHENRRDEKRRQTVAGRKKTEGEFHESCDKSEFYHMSDLERPAALFHGTERPFDQQFLASPVVDPFSGIADALEPVAKRPRLSERVMLYAKRSEELVFEPLHVVPPSVSGLLSAVAAKFGIEAEKVAALYKRCRKGVTVKIDDEMVKHYCNEDTFQIEVEPLAEDRFSVLLVELDTAAGANYSPN
ncbi:hypothetical protein QR680_009239 [Steinernema hermaphroditum]|uniref:Grh/CP2 DB domain-containing protein n=1 Tax=Steinernema hermaphroditum TaxID=289476 RepID=A0AA39ILX1_9BILA|nr:hypothetical protein QR680_009239 [Steinernema hermaphroditum]